MKKTLLLAGVCWMMHTDTQAQIFDWVAGFGSDVQDEGMAITTDADGNVYTTGNFRNMVDFDPTDGFFPLTAIGGSDVFIQKLDSLGQFVWATRMGLDGWENARGIATDADGNLLVAGNFTGTAEFNVSGMQSVELTSAGGDDGFVAKLTGDGALLWVKQMGGLTTDEAHAVVADNTGSVYVTGRFQGTADFNANENETFELTATGLGDDFFVMKLNASGEFLWATAAGGSGNDFSINLATDIQGNVYHTGYFSGAMDFDPGPNTTMLNGFGAFDIYVRKLDTNGAFVWAREIGSSGYDVGYDVCIDAAGNVCCTGRFEYTADFDAGSGTHELTSAGEQDIYLLKLSANGDYMWAHGFGSSMAEWGQSIDTDANGDVYITGFYQGTVDFDAGANEAELISAGGEDIFVCKYHEEGKFLWAHSMGSPNSMFGDRGQDLVADTQANIYTTGWFYDTADFDPGVATEPITSNGSFDIFVHKFAQPGIIGVGDLEYINNLLLYPNPNNGSFFIESKTSVPIECIEITDAMGRVVYSQKNMQSGRMNVQLENVAGAYVLQATMADDSRQNQHLMLH
ncbi:MAG: T9SS type A sorting domain-containing protein [Flavobacteriales bacterium]